MGTIRIAGAVALGDADALCDPFAGCGDPDVRFDLAGVQPMPATPLAFVAAALSDAARDDPDHFMRRYAGPDDGPLAAVYVEKVLSAVSAGEPAAEPCAGWDCFRRAESLLVLGRRLAEGLAPTLPLPETIRQGVGEIVMHLGQNVLEHSRAGAGVAALTADAEAGVIELAVADRGIGVRASLLQNRENADIESDLQALMVATAPQVTGRSDGTGGLGLYLTELAVQGLNGGQLVVRSGDARVIPNAVRERGLPDLKGTLVTARIKIDRPLDSRAVESALRRTRGVATGGGSRAAT